jgi:hypothetical protein
MLQQTTKQRAQKNAITLAMIPAEERARGKEQARAPTAS